MNQIIKNTIILFVITLVAGICLGTVHLRPSSVPAAAENPRS